MNQRTSITVPLNKPYRICLITMPFMEVVFPPLNLLQLKSVAEREFGERINVEIVLGTNLFAKHMGLDLYNDICDNISHIYSGLGDWLFRQAAFPDLADNTDTYFRQYYPGTGNHTFRRQIRSIRENIPFLLRQLIDSRDLDHADLCGFTSTFQQTGASLALARFLKKRNPELLTAMGGANCDVPMGETILNFTSIIDFVFSGPALISFPTFLRYVLSNRHKADVSIPGIHTRDKLPPFSIESSRGDELDINNEVVVDYSYFVDKLKHDFDGDIKPVISFETSRGCWWGEKSHCTFCGLNAESIGYRSLNASKAINMFERMFTQVPDAVCYRSVDTILPKNYSVDVFPYIKPPKGSVICYEVRVNLSEQELEALSDASVTLVQPGIEALSTRTLKLMRKGTTSFANIRFLKRCITQNITPFWNLLIGFPGEEEDTYNKYVRDIPSISHLPPPVGVFMLRLDRFSTYFTDADQYRIDLQPMKFYSFVYRPDYERLADLAYYFYDASFNSYTISALSWLERLRESVLQWSSHFRRPEGKAILTYDEDGRSILDSRFSSSPKKIRLPQGGIPLLELLTSKPLSSNELYSKARANNINNPESNLQKLVENKLVFEEKGRYLSLVLPRYETFTI